MRRQIIKADATDLDQITKAIEGSSYVINVLQPRSLAGYKGWFEQRLSVRNLNYVASKNVAEACAIAKSKPHLIHVSKSGEFIEYFSVIFRNFRNIIAYFCRFLIIEESRNNIHDEFYTDYQFLLHQSKPIVCDKITNKILSYNVHRFRSFRYRFLVA